MNEQEFGQYGIARRNLQALPLLVFFGAVVKLVSLLRRTTAPTWFDALDLALVAVAVVSAIGVLMWQHWARITLAIVIGLNMLLMLVAVAILLLYAGAMSGGGQVLIGLLAFRVLILAWFLSVLLNKRAIAVMDHQGNLNQLRAVHTPRY